VNRLISSLPINKIRWYINKTLRHINKTCRDIKAVTVEQPAWYYCATCQLHLSFSTVVQL